jgi:hypothetical protein
MYAKVFAQIFDSSIAEDWQVRHVFIDFLTLADLNGVLDMTPEAIARRTNVPLEIITRAIGELEKPDPKSRTPDDDGRRIVRIDEHRSWGWLIVNYQKYRAIASEEQRRARTKERVQRHRERQRNPPVTPCNASNAMQKQSQKEKQKEKEDETQTGDQRSPDCLSEVVLECLKEQNSWHTGTEKRPATWTELKTWSERHNWNRPAGDILIELEGSLKECVAKALRFIRYNNAKGWELMNWRKALRKFGDDMGEVSEVPDAWVPTIDDDSVP